MSQHSPNEYHLPEGWYCPEMEEAELLLAELQRELPPGHLLYGVPVVVFATREGIDDVLFRHMRRLERFTVIHLSWLGRTEINADHPTIEFDGSYTEFLAEEIRINALLTNGSKE